MKAYVNSRGHVLAVFKNGKGVYKVHMRNSKGEDFFALSNFESYSTREEAETELDVWFTGSCRDNTYKLIQNWHD